MLNKYHIVYADPCWNQNKGGLRTVRPNQDRSLDYPTMGLKEIKNILAQFDSNTLFLWTIDKYLFEAQRIGEELGYKLHDRIVWDKENGVAPAFTLRFSKEYLLWMYKSPMPPIAKEMRGKFTDVIREKATKHSKKPIKAYELIEALYPNCKKIELFARNKREGWDVWGNEVDSDIMLKPEVESSQPLSLFESLGLLLLTGFLFRSSSRVKD